jgi:hypothetical protein
VNRSTGILKKVCYTVEDGKRYVKSCIVEVSNVLCDLLPHLPSKHVAVLQDTTDMTFTHPHLGKRCVIKCTQVPIAPAFAMTTHKA